MTAVARNAVVVACAASTGVHAALVPDHVEENALVGVGFAVAAACLLAAALAFAGAAVPAPSAAPLTGLLLAGLILAYVTSRTVGLPVTGVEPIDRVGVATQVVQVVGLVAALLLIHHPEERTHSDEVHT